MQAAYDGGALYSQSNVELTTSLEAELLLVSSSELNAALPTLPATAASAAPAFAASLRGALQAFDSTNSLIGTSSSGLPTGIISAAAGGPLVAQYQGDLSASTALEAGPQKQFLAVLGAAILTSPAG